MIQKHGADILEKYLEGRVIDKEDEMIISSINAISFGDRGSPIRVGFTNNRGDGEPARTAKTSNSGKYLLKRYHLLSDVGMVADIKRTMYKLASLYSFSGRII